ncbi:hypothetical protein ABK040_006180 [Willaertia magna]
MPLPTFDPDEQGYERKKSAMDIDYTEQTEKAIQQSNDLIGNNKLKESLDILLNLEKQTRLSEDYENLSKILIQIIKICGESKAWQELNDQLLLLSKKRAQSKQGTQRMVQESMKYIDSTPNKESKIELINTIRKVTEGKIYVEVERARVNRMLAKMREEEGDVNEAANLLQEVQVETIGSMEVDEKIDFILEQIRLCLDKQDFVRAMIVAKKITKKSINEFNHQDLKIRYYHLMIRYYSFKKKYLEIFRCHQNLFLTPKIQEDEEAWMRELQNMVLFIILAEYDNEQHDLMHRTFNEKKIEEPKLQVYRNILKQFVSNTLIDWPKFESQYGQLLRDHPVFKDNNERFDDLRNRVVEKNIRIVSQFYSKIGTDRLARLLYLNEDKLEDFISKMVINKTIYAKIDRLQKLVAFNQSKHDTNEVLNNFSSDIVSLLQLVEKSNHLINKEFMIQGARSK